MRLSLALTTCTFLVLTCLGQSCIRSQRSQEPDDGPAKASAPLPKEDETAETLIFLQPREEALGKHDPKFLQNFPDLYRLAARPYGKHLALKMTTAVKNPEELEAFAKINFTQFSFCLESEPESVCKDRRQNPDLFSTSLRACIRGQFSLSGKDECSPWFTKSAPAELSKAM